MGLLNSLFGRKKLTASELDFIRRQSKILADCIKIIAETDNIGTYFSRYDLAEKTIARIAEIAGGDTKCIAGKQVTPNECCAMLQNEKAFHTNNFLNRYIQKETVHILGLSRGQIKKAYGVSAIIDEYSANMPKESLEYGHNLCDKMIAKIEKVASK